MLRACDGNQIREIKRRNVPPKYLTLILLSWAAWWEYKLLYRHIIGPQLTRNKQYSWSEYEMSSMEHAASRFNFSQISKPNHVRCLMLGVNKKKVPTWRKLGKACSRSGLRRMCRKKNHLKSINIDWTKGESKATRERPSEKCQPIKNLNVKFIFFNVKYMKRFSLLRFELQERENSLEFILFCLPTLKAQKTNFFKLLFAQRYLCSEVSHKSMMFSKSFFLSQ